MSVAEDDAFDGVSQDWKDTKYPKLRVLTGGKGPPEPPVEDWLSEYTPGTTFVSMKRSSQDCDLELFHVIFKASDVILLKWELCDGKLLDKYVDPKVFSKLFKPGVILGVVKLETSEEDTNDAGNSG